MLSEFIGAVIGKKGQMIRTITTDSKVSRLVDVYGLTDIVTATLVLVLVWLGKLLGTVLHDSSAQ